MVGKQVEHKNKIILYFKLLLFGFFFKLLSMNILATDIGGTSARFTICDDTRNCLKEETYLVSRYKNLFQVLNEFLKKADSESNYKIDTACFAVAGCVQGRRCEMTNVGWIIDLDQIQQIYDISTAYLLNDLEATCWGISSLKESDIVVLNQGNTSESKNAVVLGAGTGLGAACILYPENAAPFVLKTEVGHTNFAPRDSFEIEYFNYLKETVSEKVSKEHVVSGPGLVRLYQFYQKFYLNEHPSIVQFSAEELGPFIVKRALDRTTDNLYRDIVRRFAAFYGAVAGDCALSYIPAGGRVYIAGGIAPKILSVLQEGIFKENFIKKAAMESQLKNMSIYVILDEKTPLLGALNYCYIHKEKK